MGVWKLVFLTLTLTDCYLCTKAIGVCDFAEISPCQENVGMANFVTAGCKGQIDKSNEQSSTTTTGRTTDTTTITCPANMVYSDCSTCQGLCSYPNSCIQDCRQPQTCICPNGFLLRGSDCIPEEECGCFVEGKWVLPNDVVYMNTTCTERCVCQDDQLICNSSFECSPNATCELNEGVPQCYCNKGFEGDGTTCSRLPKDCHDVLQAGHTQDGVYTIFPGGWPGSSFEVYCDMTTDGGGWTVFQRRVDGTTDFYRNWESYKNGFGNIDEGNDFWLGNEKLFYLTNSNQKTYKLRVDIVTSQGSQKHEEYASFRIASEALKYQLAELGTANGTAGDGMQNWSFLFSTYDSDNDHCPRHECAVRHRSGWWYRPVGLRGQDHCSTVCYQGIGCNYFAYSSSCNSTCSASNLNGNYTGAEGENIYWKFEMNCYLMSAEMKLRPQ